MSRYQPEAKTVVISVRVTPRTAERLDAVCNRLKVTRSRFTETALDEALWKRGADGSDDL